MSVSPVGRHADSHVGPTLRPVPAISGGRPSPWDRLASLCDVGSLAPIRSAVRSERVGDRAIGGDGVLGAAGRLEGRRILCYAQDMQFLGGSVGAAHAETIIRVLQQAGRARVPVIGFVESAGARMQEGLAALDGYAGIFYEHVALSGLVPQISILTGTCAGGASYSPALTDFVIMTQSAATFLTGPGIVREVTGESVSASELGGPDVHSRNGVAHLIGATETDAICLAQRLLGYLPQHAGAPLPRVAPVPSSVPDPAGAVPANPRRHYDVRDALAGIVDAGSVLEIQPDWAPNIVVALARLEGSPIGVVANQPRCVAGVIDADGAQKAARFVRTCNAFGIPLVVLVDTPGFLPGRQQEESGVIRHGAKLLHAFAEATVPRVTVVLRKAFGGAYITMNSRRLGADLVLAWDQAQLGIMGAAQAVGIIHRRELAGPDGGEARERLAAAYAQEHLAATAAAAGGHIDEVISPHETRGRLIDALSTEAGRRDDHRIRNIPL
jgi:acetyl-CoA carboxylase carboxyltransferase component